MAEQATQARPQPGRRGRDVLDRLGPVAFGKTLAMERKRHHLSQSELGRRIGGAVQATISSWETGVTQPLPDQVFAIEDELGLDGGSLSQYLGYIPADQGPVCCRSTMEHIEAERWPAWGKRLMLSAYQEVEAAAREIEAARRGMEPDLGEEPLSPPPSDAAETVLTPERPPWRDLLQDVTHHGEDFSLSHKQVGDYMMMVRDLAEYSLKAAGSGEVVLRTWRKDETVVCEVSHPGVISDDESERGLAEADRVCDLVQVRSSPDGTVIRLHKWAAPHQDEEPVANLG